VGRPLSVGLRSLFWLYWRRISSPTVYVSITPTVYSLYVLLLFQRCPFACNFGNVLPWLEDTKKWKARFRTSLVGIVRNWVHSGRKVVCDKRTYTGLVWVNKEVFQCSRRLVFIFCPENHVCNGCISSLDNVVTIVLCHCAVTYIDVIQMVKAIAASSKASMGNLRPAWTFDIVRNRIFVTQVRAQCRVKTKIQW